MMHVCMYCWYAIRGTQRHSEEHEPDRSESVDVMHVLLVRSRGARLMLSDRVDERVTRARVAHKEAAHASRERPEVANRQEIVADDEQYAGERDRDPDEHLNRVGDREGVLAPLDLDGLEHLHAMRDTISMQAARG